MALGVIVAPNTTPIKASAIQAPSASGANTKQVLSQLKEGMEIAQRLRGSVGDSYVRVSELVALGLGTIVNGNLQLSNGGIVGGGTAPPGAGGGGSSGGGPGATGATGATGLQGPPGEDGRDGEDGLTIVGPPGPIGSQGAHAPIFWPDDPEDTLIIPGPVGATGARGLDAPIIWPDDPDDAQVIPGPAGAAGAAGAPGPPGVSGFPIFVEPDDPDDAQVIPGPAGTAGAAGTQGPPGVSGFPIFVEPDDPDDAQVIPGPVGSTGSQGPAGSGGGGGGYSTPDDWDYPEELPWRDVPQNCDVNVWSATQYFTPAAGVAVQIQGISGQNAAVIFGSSTTGDSNGLIIVAGTNSSDNALHVYNYAGSETFLQLNGDGSGILGYNSSSRSTLQFTAAGEVEISGSLVILNASGSTTIFEAASVTAPTVQGYGPTVAALVDMTPDTGTFTITYTGMTTSITGTAIWARIGNLVHLFFPAATGTSNSTSMTATGLPAILKPARAQAIPIPGFSLESAGAIPLTDANAISIATSGTVTFYLNGSATGFGSTVNKGVATGFTVSYLLN